MLKIRMQRIGRIKRFGQTRSKVDMLNLVYADTSDEKVYRALSQRGDSEACRSAFRTDVDHDSEVMPISIPN